MEINGRFTKNIALGFLSFFLSLSLVFPPFVLAELQETVDSKEDENVFIYVGDLVTVKVKELTRIALANPGIVDITNASADEITLVGRKVGETQIFIWDEAGKRQIVARVLGTDLERISQRIASLIQSAGIRNVTLEKNYYEGKIIVGGSMTKIERKKLDDLTRGFSDVLINMVVEEGEMIQIDVQFSELNTTLTKTLGFDWNAAFNVTETLPSQDGSLQDLFKLGNFSRTPAIVAVVNMLIEEGKARILSKPSLVVANGEEASFLVGGEIPIRTTTTSVGGGSVQESVTFKDYGVELKVTPEIRDGKIDIEVNVTVRDIDDSITSSGSDTAFLTRTATTKVRLLDAQTIVLAGMIQRRQSENVSRVPFISKIPVLGLLFQNKRMPTTENELVVSLTPRILKNLVTKNTPEVKPEIKSEEKKKDILPIEKKADVETKSSDVKINNPEQPKMIEAPKEIIKEKVKMPVLTKSEKLAAEKKAKADAAIAAKKVKRQAKDAALKEKLEKAEKVRLEKAEKARAAKEEKEARGKKSNKSKSIKSAPVKKQAPEKISVEVPLKVTAKTDDLSLNMSLDDPRLQDPQNVLNEEQITSIKEKYTNKIKDEMAQTISYPYEAKSSRWEGTAVLKMTILPDGNVKDVMVSQSSGYAVFDRDAVNTAEILSPFEKFAPAKNMREITVTIPVEYSEKAILGGVSP